MNITLRGGQRGVVPSFLGAEENLPFAFICAVAQFIAVAVFLAPVAAYGADRFGGFYLPPAGRPVKNTR